MVIYVAGKMTGLPDKGRPSFERAANMLREQGYVVLNPAVLPDSMPAERYMPICMAMLDAADAIYMLPGWSTSAGAKIEYEYAVYQHKVICGGDE